MLKCTKSFDFAPYTNFVLDSENINSLENKLFRNIHNTLNINYSNVFVDIGGNRGEFTDLITKIWPKNHVYTFDVTTRYYEFIKQRFKLQKNVHVYHIGMSNYVRENVPILGLKHWKNKEDKNNGMSLLLRSKKHNTILEYVNTTTVDYFFNYKYIEVLKIDAEGMDGLILRGSLNMLQKNNINIIFFESNRIAKNIQNGLFGTVKFLESFKYNSFLFGKKIYPLNKLCKKHPIFTTDNTLNIISFSKTYGYDLINKLKI